ncbi:MAG: hypothetical protein ABFC34_13125 [Methanobacterium sp.]
MKLMRFEVRKVGTKKWYGIFNNPWSCHYKNNEYYALASNLSGPKRYVNVVPSDWKFYFTENGIYEHSRLINIMEKSYLEEDFEVRTVEVKNTDKLKKRKCRVLDQHQAVIWKDK